MTTAPTPAPSPADPSVSTTPIVTSGRGPDSFHAAIDVVAREAEIAAAAAAAAASQPAAVPLPDGVTPEALAALTQAGFAVTAPGAAPAPSPEPVAPGDPVAPAEGASEGLAGLEAEVVPTTWDTVQQYSTEWMENGGTLTEASRETLKAKHNLDDQTLDQFMSGLVASTSINAQADLQNMGYTTDEFTVWETWSATAEAEDIRNSRWSLMKSPDPAHRKLGVDQLKAAYDGVNAPEPQHLRGAPGTSSNQDSFDKILRTAIRNKLWTQHGTAGDAFRAETDLRLKAAPKH